MVTLQMLSKSMFLLFYLFHIVKAVTNLLRIPGYALELELNDTKSRVGYYIRDNIKYIIVIVGDIMKFCIVKIPCCVLSKLTVIQLNLQCTLLVIVSQTYSVFWAIG